MRMREAKEVQRSEKRAEKHRAANEKEIKYSMQTEC